MDKEEARRIVFRDKKLEDQIAEDLDKEKSPEIKRDAKGRFVPGGGGGGNSFRNKMSPDDYRIRAENNEDLKIALARYMNKSLAELLRIGRSMAKSEDVTVLESMIVSVLSKAIKEGDEKRLAWMCDRVFGRPTTNVRIETNKDSSDSNLKELSTEALFKVYDIMEQDKKSKIVDISDAKKITDTG